jgi:hypothetical protein
VDNKKILPEKFWKYEHPEDETILEKWKDQPIKASGGWKKAQG